MAKFVITTLISLIAILIGALLMGFEATQHFIVFNITLMVLGSISAIVCGCLAMYYMDEYEGF